jgi:hypothetical protein
MVVKRNYNIMIKRDGKFYVGYYRNGPATSSEGIRKKGFYAARKSGSHIIVETGQDLWTSISRKDGS